MRLLRCLVVFAACFPAAAVAAMDPTIVKGPVISGVTQVEAWVAWATKHDQGVGFVCSTDALTGSSNTKVPALTLSPPGLSATFTDATCSRFHRVLLTGLAPDTAYTFTLDQPHDDGSVAGGTFRTAPATADGHVSFVVYGDNREAPVGQRWRGDHQAVADGILDHETDAAFLVNTGDLALNIPVVSGDDRGYSEFFDVERGLLGSRPIFTAIGNHETLDTQEFDDLINAPGFAGSPHPYYQSVDWGPVHFAFLDSFEGPPNIEGRAAGISDEQAAWLDQDLEQAARRGQALFAVMHQGAFSHGTTAGHGGSVPVRDKVLPILLKWRVFASLAGHDHYYQRGHEGCLDYLITGAGGAPLYDPDPTAPEVAFTVKQDSYAVITVDGTRVTGLAKDTAGHVLDSFELHPSDGTSCGVPPGKGGIIGGVDGGTTDAGASVDAGALPHDAGGVVLEGQDAGDTGAGDAPPARSDAGYHVVTASQEGCHCGASTPASMLLGVLLALRRRPATRQR